MQTKRKFLKYIAHQINFVISHIHNVCFTFTQLLLLLLILCMAAVSSLSIQQQTGNAHFSSLKFPGNK